MNKVSLLLIITAILSMLAANFGFSAQRNRLKERLLARKNALNEKVLEGPKAQKANFNKAIYAKLYDAVAAIMKNNPSTSEAMPALKAMLQTKYPELNEQQNNRLVETALGLPEGAITQMQLKSSESDTKNATTLEHKNMPLNPWQEEFLALAATGGYENAERIAELIKKHNVNINVQDADGNTAVLKAVEAANQEMFDMLMPYKPDLSLKNNVDMGILGMAEYKAMTTVDENLKKKYSILENNMLRIEFQYNMAMSAKQNCKNNARPADSSDLLNKIYATALYGDPETMDFLIGKDDEYLRNQDADRATLLTRAAFTGNIDMLKYLWKRDQECGYLDPSIATISGNLTARQMAELTHCKEATDFLQQIEKEHKEDLEDQKIQQHIQQQEETRVAAQRADANMRMLIKAEPVEKEPLSIDKKVANKKKKSKAKKAQAKKRVSPLSAVSPLEAEQTAKAAEERRNKAQEAQLQKQREYDAGLAAVAQRLKIEEQEREKEQHALEAKLQQEKEERKKELKKIEELEQQAKKEKQQKEEELIRQAELRAQALNFTAFHRPASDGTYRLF